MIRESTRPEYARLAGLKRIAAMACAMLLGSGVTAGAATVTTSGFLPGAAMLNPAATSVTGEVFQNVTGSIVNIRRSPWQSAGSPVDHTAANAWYTSVSGGGAATFDFGTMQKALSFVWGSPDTYNNLSLDLISGGTVTTLNGAAMIPPGTLGANSAFLAVADVLFDRVVFKSGSNAFEFANLSATPVPLPAAAWLLIGGVAGLGALARKRKAALA